MEQESLQKTFLWSKSAIKTLLKRGKICSQYTIKFNKGCKGTYHKEEAVLAPLFLTLKIVHTFFNVSIADFER